MCQLAVAYTQLRANETPEHLVCRHLLKKKKTKIENTYTQLRDHKTALQLIYRRLQEQQKERKQIIHNDIYK